MRMYLVGGAVRDLLLGVSPHEFDIVFDGSLEAFLDAHPQALRTSARHPVYILDGHEYVPLTGGSVRQDLLRRDFTINALALEGNGVLHLHPETLNDLREGILRPVSETVFTDDPLRLFRAARFMARDARFTLHPSALPLMRAAAGQPDSLANPQTETLAAERVGAELMKAMAGERPGEFLRTLARTNALAPWFAELAAAPELPAGPVQYHGTDSVLDHTAAVMDRIAAAYRAGPSSRADQSGKAGRRQSGEAALAAWMGLCHDLGKTLTPPEILPRHLQHEKRGVAAVRALARRLRLPRRWEMAGIAASRLHMKGGGYEQLRSCTQVDLLLELHAARLFEPFLALVTADAGKHGAFTEKTPSAMRRDMAAVLAVHLPKEARGRGPASGAKLRELRCRALTTIRNGGNT